MKVVYKLLLSILKLYATFDQSQISNETIKGVPSGPSQVRKHCAYFARNPASIRPWNKAKAPHFNLSSNVGRSKATSTTMNRTATLARQRMIHSPGPVLSKRAFLRAERGCTKVHTVLRLEHAHFASGRELGVHISIFQGPYS